MKKINIISSVLVFVALLLTASGVTIAVYAAIALQAVQVVSVLGRNWSVERKIKGGFNPTPKTESDGKPDGKPDLLDEIKNQDDPDKLDKIKLL